jgi:uncharacterized protein
MPVYGGPAVPAPIAPSERIRGIDIARGIALLGIIMVNARLFFAPFGVVIEPSLTLDGAPRSAADLAAWALVETFCTYKFISLFSMLFGFGLAMQAARAEQVGSSRWPIGLRRLGLLALVGILHWTLIWYGDILTLYAVLGLIVLAVAGLSRRTVGWIAVTLMAVVLVVTIAGAGLQVLGSMWLEGMPSAEAAVIDPALRGLAAMVAAKFDPSSPIWLAAETAAFREGPFLDALTFRVIAFAFGFLAAFFTYGWQSLLMMVCGVYAFKAGLFDHGASSMRRRLALLLLPLGVLVAAAAPAPILALGFDSTPARIAYALLLPLGAMVLPFAYATIIIEWGPRLPAVIATALERTGRMSFTVYLGESLVCTALSCWWGLAWFGTLGDAEVAGTVFLVWLGLVLFATAWLGVFRIGPFEWLWRLSTYAGNGTAARANPG